MVQITGKTNVGEILALYPQIKKALQKFGIPFSGCGSNILLNMSIEQVAQRYQVNIASLVQSIQMVIIQANQRR
jgi:iron-sulfur cluster repair protein YtfE (RIC family)